VVKLVHEVWEQTVDGMVLHSCCLAGPLGNDHRSTLVPNARRIHTFKAGSHFEAMTIYHSLLGRGQYTTNQPCDYESYPEQLRQEQQE
jgi:hypothetical protein